MGPMLFLSPNNYLEGFCRGRITKGLISLQNIFKFEVVAARALKDEWFYQSSFCASYGFSGSALFSYGPVADQRD
jgi:hypothetical protein